LPYLAFSQSSVVSSAVAIRFLNPIRQSTSLTSLVIPLRLVSGAITHMLRPSRLVRTNYEEDRYFGHVTLTTLRSRRSYCEKACHTDYLPTRSQSATRLSITHASWPSLHPRHRHLHLHASFPPTVHRTAPHTVLHALLSTKPLHAVPHHCSLPTTEYLPAIHAKSPSVPPDSRPTFAPTSARSLRCSA